MSHYRQVPMCRMSAPACASLGSRPTCITWMMQHDSARLDKAWRYDLHLARPRRILRRIVGRLLAPSEATAFADADAAAAVARHHLYRLADRTAAAEFLLYRRFLRLDQLRVHACDLCRASEPRQFRHHRPYRRHGGHGDDRIRRHRLP